MTKRRIDTYAQHKNEMIARRKRQLGMKPGIWPTSVIRFNQATKSHVSVKVYPPYQFEEWRSAYAWGKYIPAGERCNVKPTPIRNVWIADQMNAMYEKVEGYWRQRALIGTTMSVMDVPVGLKSPPILEEKEGEYLDSGDQNGKK